MKVDKDTKLYFSVSSKPGNFGASLYNRAFQELNINAIYKPLKLERKEDFPLFLDALRTIGASGLSVSMPFKRLAAHYANGHEYHVHSTHSANTLVFLDAKKFACYNTDYFGFIESAKEILGKCRKVIVYGKGSVSNTIVCALDKLGKEFFRIGRGQEALLLRNREETKERYKDDFLINASPAGMEAEDDIFTPEVVSQFKYVFDVVVKKETNLIKNANELGIKNVNGVQMSLEQLCKQFEIYTNIKSPRELFIEELQKNGYL